MTFKLFVISILIPLPGSGSPSQELKVILYPTSCMHLERLLTGERVIDPKTQLRSITKARCVPDEEILPPAGYGPGPLPKRQYSPDDPDDPLMGYDPLKGIVPIR